MSKPLWISICAVLAALAGHSWGYKASAIIMTGDQPPLAYELGQLLFPFGVVGLSMTLTCLRGMARAAPTFALLSVLSTMLAYVYSHLPGARISSGEEFVFPYSLLVMAGGLGGFLGLLLLGVSVARESTTPSTRRIAILVISLAPVLTLGTAMIHMEMPILLIALSWLALAYVLWTSAGDRASFVLPE